MTTPTTDQLDEAVAFAIQHTTGDDLKLFIGVPIDKLREFAKELFDDYLTQKKLQEEYNARRN